MEVQLSGARSRSPVREHILPALLCVGLMGLVLAPGLAWPAWFRVLSTVLFVLLGLIVSRAYVGALLSFRRPAEPPAKPSFLAWPKVSVLVPAYNEGSVLPRTLASMLEVDYPADRIEFVYVYEKRSSDGTGDLIRSYAAHDARFKAIERDERTGGKAAACNFGFRHCTGEYIVSLDADHALAPGAVKRAIRHFLADPKLGCVKGRVVGINTRESFLALQAKVERDAIEKGDIYVRQLWKGFTFFGGGQAVFRSKVFQDLGVFDETVLVEDVDFSLRLHENGWGIKVDPSILTFEENPAGFKAWYAQRKRWARGWMQVARRYLPRVGTMRQASVAARLDMAHTLAYALVPVAFALLLPMGLLGLFGIDTSTYFGSGADWVWTAYALAPLVLAGAVLVQDLRDGVWHDPMEAPAFLTLWAYLMVQSVVFLLAFMDEFVLRRKSVYVKTAKTGHDRVATRPTRPVRAQRMPILVSQED